MTCAGQFEFVMGWCDDPDQGHADDCKACGGRGYDAPYVVGFDGLGECIECGGTGECEMSPLLGGRDCSEGA